MVTQNTLSSPFTNFPSEGALPNLDKTYVIYFLKNKNNKSLIFKFIE